MRKLTLILSFAAISVGALSQVEEGTRGPLTNANSIYGPTGLIKIPTAYTTAQGDMQFSAAFGRNIRVPSINYGVVKYIEIGGAFIDRESGSNKAIGTAKVTIVPENFKWFEIGVGIIDPADAINQTIYFVASADFVPPNWDVPERGLQTLGLKGHIGAGTGLFQEKIFGGAEVLFSKSLSLIGEWDTEDFNAAIRFAPTNYFRIQLGVQGKDIHMAATTSFKF